MRTVIEKQLRNQNKKQTKKREKKHKSSVLIYYRMCLYNPSIARRKILLDNLIRLCNINLSRQSSDYISERTLLLDTPLSVVLHRGTQLLQVARNSEFTLFAKQPLPPVASQAQVADSAAHQFADMYPVFPTIDLVDSHVYDLEESTFGWRPDAAAHFAHTHTFFHVDGDGLSGEANVAKLMMFAFGSAVAQSKLLQSGKVGLKMIDRQVPFFWQPEVAVNYSCLFFLSIYNLFIIKNYYLLININYYQKVI